MTGKAFVPRALALSPLEAEQLLHDRYGVRTASLHQMGSELSSVFRAQIDDGRALAFKATYHSCEEFRLAQWRVAAMAHLQSSGVPVGETLPDRDGSPLCVADVAPGRVIVHVGEWLNGSPLERLEPTPATLRAVGRNAADIVSALSGWPEPPVPVAHVWELLRTVQTLDETMHRVTDPQIRGLIADAAERFACVAHDQLGLLPHSAIHHDLHDSNLLIDAARSKVCGVLDFGDMVWGPRIAELAVSAAYASRLAKEPTVALVQVAKGWGNVVQLEDAEIDVLFSAAIGRLAVNLSVWTTRADSERGNYAHARSARTRRALEDFMAADSSRVQLALRDALQCA